MRDESENGGGMRDDKIVMAGCAAIKILRRKQDLLIWSGSMRRDSFKIDGMDTG